MEQTLTKSNIQKLEYLDNYKKKQDKRLLIDEMLESKNIEEVEFASIYDIDDHYASNRISNVQALNAYNKLKPFNHDAGIALNLFKSYIYAEEQAFGFLDEHMMGLEYAINSISNEYIKGMYKVRYCVISIASLVTKGYIKEVRQVCRSVMNDNLDNYYSALVAVWYANTYLIENPEKALEIYENALGWTEGERCDAMRFHLKNNIDFANIMMGNYPKYLDFKSTNPSAVHNIAFWYIRKGGKDIKVGEELLNTIDYDSLNNVQKAYHHFYRGFISDSMKHFLQSVKHFKLGGEFYFRKLALNELEKLGLDKDMIEALSV